MWLVAPSSFVLHTFTGTIFAFTVRWLTLSLSNDSKSDVFHALLCLVSFSVDLVVPDVRETHGGFPFRSSIAIGGAFCHFLLPHLSSSPPSNDENPGGKCLHISFQVLLWSSLHPFHGHNLKDVLCLVFQSLNARRLFRQTMESMKVEAENWLQIQDRLKLCQDVRQF